MEEAGEGPGSRVPLDRRRFLAQVGVGASVAGAAWAQPAITTTSAAAAATPCVCSGSLVLNGSGETTNLNDAGDSNDRRPTDWTSSPAWQTAPSAQSYGLSTYTYGLGGYPATTDLRPTPGSGGTPATPPGSRLFYGGNPTAANPTTVTATQTRPISPSCLTQVAAGRGFYRLSGWIGGYLTQTDRCQVNLDWLNNSGVSVGTAQIGPVTAAQRNNLNRLLFRCTSGAIPVSATQALITLRFTRDTGTSNDGYLDLLSLEIGCSAFTCAADGTP